MGLGGRVGDEAFYAAEAFSEADEFHRFQKGERCLVGVGVEGEHSAGAAGLFVVDFLALEAGEGRIEDALYLRVVGEPFGESLGIFLGRFHAERQGLDAAGDKPAVHGRQAAADGFIKETNLFCHVRILCDHEAREGVVVAGEIFRAAVNHDVSAQVDGVAEVRAHERIVRDEERAVSVSEIRDGLNVSDLHHRVRRGFDEDSLHRVIEGGFDFFQVGAIYETEVQTVLLVDETEETDGAAIEIVSGNDGVPRLEKFHDHGNGGHAGGVAGTVTAVLKSANNLLRALAGGVLHAGVVIARGLAQLRVAEGGRLENRNRNATRRVFPVASVNADGFDVHSYSLLWL